MKNKSSVPIMTLTLLITIAVAGCAQTTIIEKDAADWLQKKNATLSIFVTRDDPNDLGNKMREMNLTEVKKQIGVLEESEIGSFNTDWVDKLVVFVLSNGLREGDFVRTQHETNLRGGRKFSNDFDYLISPDSTINPVIIINGTKSESPTKLVYRFYVNDMLLGSKSVSVYRR